MRRTKVGSKGTETHSATEEEVEKTFCLSRSDVWVIYKKTKSIIILEFKRTSDTSETYYSDMKEIVVQQNTPILEGLNVLSDPFLHTPQTTHDVYVYCIIFSAL
jgi:hypothetical protein